MLDIFIIISLIAVTIGSFTDIKTLEVPDWLNYSLIAIGLGGNLIFSIYHWDYHFILRSFLGLAVSFGIGMLMFYTGQWGGGDSKMIFGLGALLGIDFPFKFGFYFMFLVNVLFFGAVYGLLWVIVMAIKNRKKLSKEIKKSFKEKKLLKIRMISGVITIIALILIYFIPAVDSRIKMVFGGSLVMLYFMNYIFIIVRAVEKVSMIRMIDPNKLTEGDWIVEDIIVDGKKIVGPKDLGIEKDQIKKLLKFKELGKIDKIKVKYGIPFVPSFFMAMVYTVVTNNVFLMFFM